MGWRLNPNVVLSKNPHTDKGGFQEKGGGGFNGKQRPENIPYKCIITRPVGAELKLEGYARNDAKGKVNEKQLAPEFGHPGT